MSNSDIITKIYIQEPSSATPIIKKIGAEAGDVVLENDITIDGVTCDEVEEALNTLNTKKINISQKGVASGVAELDANGKVPSSQLPSYVDDVKEGYLNTTDGKFYEESIYIIEITPEADKIYVDKATNITYRWSGSAFVAIGSDLALGETSSTAYRGDRGKIAYDTALANDDRLDAIDGIIPQTASTSNKLATADDITNIAVEALHDVDLTNIQDGQTLIWDATNSKWINGQGGKTYTAGTGITIDSNDVISLTNGEEIVLPINPSVEPTENGAIWITT